MTIRISGAPFFPDNLQGLEIRHNRGEVVYEQYALHRPVIS